MMFIQPHIIYILQKVCQTCKCQKVPLTARRTHEMVFHMQQTYYYSTICAKHACQCEKRLQYSSKHFPLSLLDFIAIVRTFLNELLGPRYQQWSWLSMCNCKILSARVLNKLPFMNCILFFECKTVMLWHQRKVHEKIFHIRNSKRSSQCDKRHFNRNINIVLIV